MNVVALPGSGHDIEEPDWTRLMPDVTDGETTVRLDGWRDFAHGQWTRITRELRDASTLASVNGHQIQRLVLAYVRYDMAAARLFSMSAITESPKTRTPMLNIWQVEMRAADSDATTAEMELCLSPRRRGSASATKKKSRAVTAADRFLAAKA